MLTKEAIWQLLKWEMHWHQLKTIEHNINWDATFVAMIVFGIYGTFLIQECHPTVVHLTMHLENAHFTT